MIALVGATPVCVTIDPVTYNIGADRIEEAITKNTRGIVAVSLYGQCPEMEAILSVAGEYGLFVIEDGAQSFGAERNGRRACGWPPAGAAPLFSVQPCARVRGRRMGVRARPRPAPSRRPPPWAPRGHPCFRAVRHPRAEEGRPGRPPAGERGPHRGPLPDPPPLAGGVPGTGGRKGGFPGKRGGGAQGGVAPHVRLSLRGGPGRGDSAGPGGLREIGRPGPAAPRPPETHSLRSLHSRAA